MAIASYFYDQAVNAYRKNLTTRNRKVGERAVANLTSFKEDGLYISPSDEILKKIECDITPSPQKTFLIKHSPSINFRLGLFNVSLTSEITHTYKSIEAQVDLQKIIYQVRELNGKLEKFFKEEGSSNSPEIKANEVYSQYLQHLIYFISRNHLSPRYLKELCLAIIQEEKFFYVNSGRVTVWQDPKHRYTSLHSVAREYMAECAALLLQRADVACGGKKTESFRDFISRWNRFGDSALHCAAASQHTPTVDRLLGVAAETFDNKSELRQFIMHVNHDGFSPLNIAACGDNQELINTMLIAIGNTLGGLHTEAFYRFMNEPAQSDSVLHAAVLRLKTPTTPPSSKFTLSHSKAISLSAKPDERMQLVLQSFHSLKEIVCKTSKYLAPMGSAISKSSISRQNDLLSKISLKIREIKKPNVRSDILIDCRFLRRELRGPGKDKRNWFLNNAHHTMSGKKIFTQLIIATENMLHQFVNSVDDFELDRVEKTDVQVISATPITKLSSDLDTDLIIKKLSANPSSFDLKFQLLQSLMPKINAIVFNLSVRTRTGLASFSKTFRSLVNAKHETKAEEDKLSAKLKSSCVYLQGEMLFAEISLKGTEATQSALRTLVQHVDPKISTFITHGTNVERLSRASYKPEDFYAKLDAAKVDPVTCNDAIAVAAKVAFVPDQEKQKYIDLFDRAYQRGITQCKQELLIPRVMLSASYIASVAKDEKNRKERMNFVDDIYKKSTNQKGLQKSYLDFLCKNKRLKDAKEIYHSPKPQKMRIYSEGKVTQEEQQTVIEHDVDSFCYHQVYIETSEYLSKLEKPVKLVFKIRYIELYDYPAKHAIVDLVKAQGLTIRELKKEDHAFDDIFLELNYQPQLNAVSTLSTTPSVLRATASLFRPSQQPAASTVSTAQPRSTKTL